MTNTEYIIAHWVTENSSYSERREKAIPQNYA